MAPGAGPVNDEELLDVAEHTADALLSSSWEHPFGPDWDVFKVGGKVFLLTTQVPGRACVTLKCEPIRAQGLVAEHAEITAGYHMNKRHWVSVWPGTSVSADLLKDLVRNSYVLVARGLPRAKRPLLTEVAATTADFDF